MVTPNTGCILSYYPFLSSLIDNFHFANVVLEAKCSFTLRACEKESSGDPKTNRMRTQDFACLPWDCVSSMHSRMFWKSYETSAILHPYLSFVHSGFVCVCVCGICAHVSRAFIGLCDLSSHRKGKGFICLQLFIYLFIHLINS